MLLEEHRHIRHVHRFGFPLFNWFAACDVSQHQIKNQLAVAGICPKAVRRSRASPACGGRRTQVGQGPNQRAKRESIALALDQVSNGTKVLQDACRIQVLKVSSKLTLELL